MIEHNRCHKCGSFIEDADTCSACLEACRCSSSHCKKLGVCFQPSSKQYFCVVCAGRINYDIETQVEKNKCIYPHRWGPDKKSGIEKFDVLLAQWRENEEKMDNIRETQYGLVQQINQVFSQVLEKDKLLATFSWNLDVSGNTLWCKANSPQVLEFFSRLEWDDASRHYHHTLRFGDYRISLNDNHLEINFDAADDLVGFCQKNDIKPDLSEVIAEKNHLDAKKEELDNLVNRLSFL